MYENLKEYKGVRVIRKKVKPGKPLVNGSYSKLRNRITLYDNFFTHDKIIQTSILEHEHAHYVWYKMPKLYQKIWEWISNGKLIKTLNILGLTKCTKNAYVTSYAKTKFTEDFAECIESHYVISKKYKGKSFRNFADFKMKVAKSMYDYFSKK